MNTRNFPARKLARALAADERNRTEDGIKAAEYKDDPRVQNARDIRTKKDRRSRFV